jgi:hypothetical protein
MEVVEKVECPSCAQARKPPKAAPSKSAPTQAPRQRPLTLARMREDASKMDREHEQEGKE